jgi:hypothetical protein
MTREDIKKMALESGLIGGPVYTQGIEKFAALVAAHEREECIAIAESKRHSPNFVLASIPSQNGTAVDIANLIRDRGEK